MCDSRSACPALLLRGIHSVPSGNRFLPVDGIIRPHRPDLSVRDGIPSGRLGNRTNLAVRNGTLRICSGSLRNRTVLPDRRRFKGNVLSVHIPRQRSDITGVRLVGEGMSDRCDLMCHILRNFGSDFVHSFNRPTDRLIVAIGFQLCQSPHSGVFIEDRLYRSALGRALPALVDQLHVVGVIQESLESGIQIVFVQRFQIGLQIVMLRWRDTLLIALLPLGFLRIRRLSRVVRVTKRFRNLCSGTNKMVWDDNVNPVLSQRPLNQRVIGCNECHAYIWILITQRLCLFPLSTDDVVLVHIPT